MPCASPIGSGLPSPTPRLRWHRNRPPVWAELPDNAAFRWATGDEESTAALIAAAMHVTRLRVVNNRLVASPIEPRSATAEYDPARDAWTLHTATQGVWLVRDLIASAALGVPGDRLRVITPDVGGSFGSKIFPYPEHVLVCHAAQKLRRPVRWTADRSEAFLADVHGRDTVSMAELAIDADLRFTALRVRVVANLGAYLSTFAPFVPTMIGTAVLPSVYDFRSVFAEVTGSPHQHDAGRRLPRRGNARDHLPRRTAHRCRGPRTRPRPCRPPPAEPRAQPSHAVPRGVGQRLRQRRLRPLARNPPSRGAGGRRFQNAAPPRRQEGSGGGSVLPAISRRLADLPSNSPRSGLWPIRWSFRSEPSPAGKGTRRSSLACSPTDWASPRTSSKSGRGIRIS